jgi:hypothetical protein
MLSERVPLILGTDSGPRSRLRGGCELQVGPESDWWLDRCFCVPVAAITADPPMTTPTVVPIPTAD